MRKDINGFDGFIVAVALIAVMAAWFGMYYLTFSTELPMFVRIIAGTYLAGTSVLYYYWEVKGERPNR